MNTLKKVWTPETDFAHTPAIIGCLLIVPFPELLLNDEGGKLFLESNDEYAKRARLVADIHGIQREEENEGAISTKVSMQGNGDRSLKTVNRSNENDILAKVKTATKKKYLKRL